MNTILARTSLAATGAFVALVAALHIVKVDVDPSWHVLSEYAIGPYGWLMVLAFGAFAAGYLALFAALRSRLRGVVGRIGLGLLLASAAGLAIAAVFTTDPITVTADDATTRGSLHNLGGTLGTAMPFAATFVTWKLARDPAWRRARRALLWTVAGVWLGFVLFTGSLGVMLPANDGVFGPDVLIGWPNRFDALANAVWLATVAWYAIRLEGLTTRQAGPIINSSVDQLRG